MADTSPTNRRALFEAVIDLPAEERETYLDVHCSDDALRRAVEELLRIDDGSDAEFFCTPVARPDTIDDEVPLPETIGRYRITRRIGTGGMGVVYEGTQESPHRAVAIKVVRAELVSERMLSRLRNEAEILGRLDHPGIARIYEASTARTTGSAERPFFAMELVRGTPLLEHVCDRSTADRLQLFVDVCDAVHHAHQKGVIHRDLKPANILVATTNDGGSQVKVLDFGIARATDSDIQAVTVHTDVGHLLGTVPYMSPEQLLGDVGRLDTRSDVYALGVVLFEMLTGVLPHDVRERSIPEAARIIRDEDSTRLSAIEPTLRGDLEWIVAKALEKDVDRRYDSASAFGADIRRHLAHEPVVAGPPSAAYRLRKFVRRNRTGVAWAAIAAVALGIGIAATIAQTVRARQAEQVSRSALADWRRESDRARIGVQFLVMALGKAQDAAAVGAEPTLREALDLATEAIDERFSADPQVEAAARRLMGEVYHGMGAHDASVEQYIRAYRLLAPSPDSPSDYLAMIDLLIGAQGAVRERGLPGSENAAASWYVLDLLPFLETIVGKRHSDLAAAMRAMRRELVISDARLDAERRKLREALRRAGTDAVTTELDIRSAFEIEYERPADDAPLMHLDRVLAVHATVPREIGVHRSLAAFLLLVDTHLGNRFWMPPCELTRAAVQVVEHEDANGVQLIVGMALWMDARTPARAGEEELRVIAARRLVEEQFTLPAWMLDDAQSILGAALMQRGRNEDRDEIAQRLVAGNRGLRLRRDGDAVRHRLLEARRGHALLRLAAMHLNAQLTPLSDDVVHLADQPAVLAELSAGIGVFTIRPFLEAIAHSMEGRAGRSEQWYSVAMEARMRAGTLPVASTP